MQSLKYLRNFIENLDFECSGVYKMIDEKKEILYIGKAKNLKKRLLNYLNFDSLVKRIQDAVSKIHQVEIIVTKNEEEALILEAQLIRSLKPKYNILLKEEKAYNFIFLNDLTCQDFPSFEILKTKNLSELKISNKKIYGPFFSSFQIDQILNVIYANFGIRNCKNSFFQSHSKRLKSCLQFDIGKCLGPCIKKISTEDYKRNLDEAIDFLKGNKNSLMKNLEKKMFQASNELQFESAIILREKLKALKNFYNQQFLGAEFDGDYVSVSKIENTIGISKGRIFGGNNYGSKTYFFENISSPEDQDSIIHNFLIQAFLEIPPLNHVYCNFELENQNEILVSSKIKYKVQFINPLRGKKRKMIENMILNGEELIKLKLNKVKNNFDLIEKIKIWLEIEKNKKIENIEIFDNSHILGKEAVGAVISFSVSEGFVKKNYRAYGIKSTQVGDDYQMLREVFFKRFHKHKLPDLIIVDGGLAHLKTAISSIKEIYGENFDDFEIISIAKGEKRNDGLETIFLKSGASLKTTHEDPKIHFLQRLRDEAHRFGIKKHRELRNKKSFL